jgi:5S rRNA maturation endonuclease (ribonuclease M5)
MSRCPAHDDRNPSLSISEGENSTLLHCHAGCSVESICAALGIEVRELSLDNKPDPRIVAIYDYMDEVAGLLYQVVRFDPKDFRQRRPDGNGGWIWSLNGTRRVLYRLPEVLKAKSVLVVEGEKDCESARTFGLVATCNAAGAGKWREEYSELLRGKRVAVIADADEPGRKHAQQVATSLYGKAESVKVLELPDAKDLAEWVEHGGTREALLELVQNTPTFLSAHIVNEFGQKPFPVEKGPNLPFKTAAQVEKETPTEITWVSKPYIAAGAITEIDGKVKLAGKSTWVTYMCRAVLDGALFMGEPTLRTPVVYLTEQPPSSWRLTLERAGILGREDFSCLYFKDIRGLSWQAVADAALVECKRTGARLLVVDTLSQFAGITGDSENDAGEALRAMAPLQIAAGEGVAVVVIRHERKSGGSVGESGRGSSAFAGAVDTVISIRRPEGNGRNTLRVIQAVGRFDETPEELVIELKPDGFMVLGTSTEVAAIEAKSAILSSLPGTPDEAVDLAAIVEATKVARATAQRAITDLRNEGRIQTVGKGKRGDPWKYYVLRSGDSGQAPARDRENSFCPNYGPYMGGKNPEPVQTWSELSLSEHPPTNGSHSNGHAVRPCSHCNESGKCHCRPYNKSCCVCGGIGRVPVSIEAWPMQCVRFQPRKESDPDPTTPLRDICAVFDRPAEAGVD